MQITGEFIRNAIGGAALIVTLVSGYASIKSDIAILKVQVAEVGKDLDVLTREVRSNVATTVFEANAR